MNGSVRRQRVVPYLYYQDAAKALDFLCGAFGFEDSLRVPRDDGSLMHAEVKLGGDTIMIGTPPNPEVLAAARMLEARPSSVLCYVPDVDAHYVRARKASARIVSAPADTGHGARMYCAADPEGHEWYFSTSPSDAD